jgi:hypothetical protein
LVNELLGLRLDVLKPQRYPQMDYLDRHALLVRLALLALKVSPVPFDPQVRGARAHRANWTAAFNWYGEGPKMHAVPAVRDSLLAL